MGLRYTWSAGQTAKLGGLSGPGEYLASPHYESAQTYSYSCGFTWVYGKDGPLVQSGGPRWADAKTTRSYFLRPKFIGNII